MTVYVDDYRAPFRRMVMCHMLADTEAELHAMAAAIGVARRWYQLDHYDICLSKRAAAVKLGAVEVGYREMPAIRRRLRAHILSEREANKSRVLPRVQSGTIGN